MPRESPTRTKMLQSGALLFRERGVTGTAFADVLEHSGAPRGSIYYHFPGGKEEFARDATAYAGDVITAGLSAGPEDLHELADQHIDGWIAGLRASDFDAGCPVAAAALEGAASPDARDAAGSAFSSWTAVLEARLVDAGVAADVARDLALFVLAAVEGGLILCRAQRSPDALEAVRTQVHAVLRAHLPA